MREAALSQFREQIIEAGKQNTALSIEGGGSKDWFGNATSPHTLSTKSYQGILDYQAEELVITACAGTPIAEIEDALTQKNQMLPLNHLTSESKLLLAE